MCLSVKMLRGQCMRWFNMPLLVNCCWLSLLVDRGELGLHCRISITQKFILTRTLHIDCLIPTVIAMSKCDARQLNSLARQSSTMGHHNCSMPPEMCWRKHSLPHSTLSQILHLGQGTHLPVHVATEEV